MFLLIKDDKNQEHIIRTNDIRRISKIIGKTRIQFVNKKEFPSIFIKETPAAFYKKYLIPATQKQK